MPPRAVAVPAAAQLDVRFRNGQLASGKIFARPIPRNVVYTGHGSGIQEARKHERKQELETLS
jgi:hypothetical protein